MECVVVVVFVVVLLLVVVEILIFVEKVNKSVLVFALCGVVAAT